MRWIPLILAATLLRTSAVAAVAADQPDKVTVMPAFEVASLASEFEHWIKLSSPHYLLYTDASVREAQGVLRRLEGQRLAEAKFLGREFLSAPPCVIVLPTASSVWKKLQSTANVEWPVAVSTCGQPLATLGVAQYDWQDHGLGILQGALATSHLPLLGLGGPLWFTRGIGTFFETANLKGTDLTLGDLNQNRTREVTRRGWLAWGTFFQVTVKSPEFFRENLIGRYDGQSAAFLHFFFTEKDPVWLSRLNLWRTRFKRDYVPTSEDFKADIGQDWKQWQATMEAHLARTSSNTTVFHFTDEQLGGEPEPLDLRTREMRDLFVLVQILNQSTPASEQALDYILAHGLRTPSLRGLLISACLDKNRLGPALEQLREFLATNPENPAAFATAARLRLSEIMSAVSPDTRLKASEIDELNAWARRALKLEPNFNEAREVLAWNSALAPHCDRQDVEAILEHFRNIRPPGRQDQVGAALAIALWRVGELVSARTVSTTLMNSPFVHPEIHALIAALIPRLEISPAP